MLFRFCLKENMLFFLHFDLYIIFWFFSGGCVAMAFLEPTDIDSVEKNHDYDYDFECKICHSFNLSDINQPIRSGITGHVVFIGHFVVQRIRSFTTCKLKKPI